VPPQATGEQCRQKGTDRNPNWSLALQPVQVETSKGGDLGYTRGTCSLPPIQRARRRSRRRAGLSPSFAKEADGSWKVVQEIDNAEAVATSK
jgi:ketosteroid isomerase-like protein